MSWLKKNELDLKRHVVELRDSVRNNWSTTGQELTKELRQYWRSSRPSSPARSSLGSEQGPSKSPNSLTHLPRLDVPRADSPGGSNGPSNDFATGYSLGLIGGVRSWVSLRPTNDQQNATNDDTDDSESCLSSWKPAGQR